MEVNNDVYLVHLTKNRTREEKIFELQSKLTMIWINTFKFV